MAEDEDDSQKTEEPTEKRLRDALDKGQVIHSKELTTFLVFVTFTIIFSTILPSICKKTLFFLHNFMTLDINISDLSILFQNVIMKFLLYIILPLFLLMVTAILSSIVQSGKLIFTTSTIEPKLTRISVFAGIERLFSFKSLFEFLKGIVKIIIVGLAIYIAVIPYLSKIKTIYDFNIIDILRLLFELIRNMLIATCIIIGFVASLDFFYQRYEYRKKLMMSKRDIKEEFKQQEGSPEIKNKLRKIRNERAQQRMAQDVPKADVIVTNPIHYSIALKYDKSSMQAPKLIAKGVDFIALKIRDIANKHDIPVIENVTLARSLYADVEVDQEIPIKYYKAVAQIINYVYSLRKDKKL